MAPKAKGAAKAKASKTPRVSTPTPQKRKAATKVDEVDNIQSPTAKKRRPSNAVLSLGERVQAKINYNFPGWTAEQIDGHTVDGETLRDVVTKDTKLNDDSVSDAPVMAKLYYEDKRQRFDNPASAVKRITVADKAQMVDKYIEKALEGIVVQSKNYAAISAWLESANKVNQKSLALLLKGALKCPPAVGAPAVKFNIALMRYLKRTGMDVTFATEMRIMKNHFDLTLEKSLLQFKSQEWTKATWWLKHRSIASFVLPVDHTQKCFDVPPGESWGNLQTELESVVGSGDTGAALFGTSLQDFKLQSLAEMIDKVVKAMIGHHVDQPLEEKKTVRRCWGDSLRLALTRGSLSNNRSPAWTTGGGSTT